MDELVMVLLFILIAALGLSYGGKQIATPCTQREKQLTPAINPDGICREKTTNTQ